ncbi:hypothetical protein [Streptomyces yaizuensis]|uniref:Uncharacterized protein n=1 Tax=Streptomyces yaizuensis TaxID=2989713 RepID=A0ABQ5P6D8_9ACTN|nr:hypothetical protein [Streptomyces sp. YSPA8]GLF98124.1 hypothetical protein SYYSPA8_27525 [Streptomyces sp. YSPA8]
MPAPEIARELRVSPVTVASRISAPRHGDDVTARGRAQLAAAALLTDSAHCRLTHGRFPALSLSAFAAGHPAAGRGRQP